MATGQLTAEQGFVSFAMIALLLPLVILVGAVSTTMQGRNTGLLQEIHREKALMAAESGLDETLFRASKGSLVSGVSFVRSLGDGMSFQVEPIHLKTDGIDNDGDTLIDETDEDVYQVTIDGIYGSTRRRLAGYLGPLPLLPAPVAAVGTHRPDMGIKLENVVEISGIDTDMDGDPGPGPDVPGIAIANPPGTTADLLAELDATEQTKVVGSTPAPSLATMAPIDLDALVQQLRNSANIVLLAGKYEGANLGNGPAGITNIVFRDGDLKLDKNSRGAGILVVTKHLEIKDGSRWDGVIIVMEDHFKVEKNSSVYGAVLMGPDMHHELKLKDGTSFIRYSSEAIDLASSLLPGKYVAFNGWQEIAVN